MLKDWCLEAEFNKLTAAHKLAQDRHCKIEQEVIDIDQVDVSGSFGTKNERVAFVITHSCTSQLVDGRITDQGPALVIKFVAQQTMCVKDLHGKVVEGDQVRLLTCHHFRTATSHI